MSLNITNAITNQFTYVDIIIKNIMSTLVYKEKMQY